MLLLMPLWGYYVKLLLLCKSLNAGYFCLIAIVGNKLKVERTILQDITNFKHISTRQIPLNKLFTNQNYNDVKEPFDNQLSLSLF